MGKQLNIWDAGTKESELLSFFSLQVQRTEKHGWNFDEMLQRLFGRAPPLLS